MRRRAGPIKLGVTGTFDSLNPFIVKGTPAGLGGLIETLTTQTEDDNLSEYGLLAESMEVAPDKSWIIYDLRPEARWHDGQPVTADDVIFSFETLTRKAIRNIATTMAMSPARKNWASGGSNSSSSTAATASCP